MMHRMMVSGAYLPAQQAANYLNIKDLLDLTCLTVANMIKGYGTTHSVHVSPALHHSKTPEEIRKTFNIVNDFTPEEEEEVCSERAWRHHTCCLHRSGARTSGRLNDCTSRGQLCNYLVYTHDVKYQLTPICMPGHASRHAHLREQGLACPAPQKKCAFHCRGRCVPSRPSC